jgi:hypothetical protein
MLVVGPMSHTRYIKQAKKRQNNRRERIISKLFRKYDALWGLIIIL